MTREAHSHALATLAAAVRSDHIHIARNVIDARDHDPEAPNRTCAQLKGDGEGSLAYALGLNLIAYRMMENGIARVDTNGMIWD
jgi:hypothetical protein